MTKIQDLLLKRDSLVQDARVYRESVIVEIKHLEAPMSIADKGWAFFSFVKNNPLIVMSAMSLLSSKFRKLSAAITGGQAIFNIFQKLKK